MKENVKVVTNLDWWKDRISRMNAHEFAEFIKDREPCEMCVKADSYEDCGFIDMVNTKGAKAANKMCIKNMKKWLKQEVWVKK
jgi:hypothetical protein